MGVEFDKASCHTSWHTRALQSLKNPSWAVGEKKLLYCKVIRLDLRARDKQTWAEPQEMFNWENMCWEIRGCIFLFGSRFQLMRTKKRMERMKWKNDWWFHLHAVYSLYIWIHTPSLWRFFQVWCTSVISYVMRCYYCSYCHKYSFKSCLWKHTPNPSLSSWTLGVKVWFFLRITGKCLLTGI